MIVQLLADDALGAQREWSRIRSRPMYLQAFDEMAEQPGNELLVAVFDDEVIGCLQLTISPASAAAACVARRLKACV